MDKIFFFLQSYAHTYIFNYTNTSCPFVTWHILQLVTSGKQKALGDFQCQIQLSKIKTYM